jgi:16S rRNA (adenine1518-N6/adenine1519-N6)-dimethyltransferase
LLRQAGSVTAVEFDAALARKLPGQFPGTNLTVVNDDILQFDLSVMPAGYKVVANVPYYITSKIVERLVTAENKPSVIVLLVQKEVAERLAAKPGDMSIMGVAAQLYAEVHMGSIVPAELFTPPPKVDSAVVVLTMRPESLLGDGDERQFFRVVKAGFSAKRKKLRSSLSGGLAMKKSDVETLLANTGVSPEARAEDLSIDDWKRLVERYAQLAAA